MDPLAATLRLLRGAWALVALAVDLDASARGTLRFLASVAVPVSSPGMGVLLAALLLFVGAWFLAGRLSSGGAPSISV